jgi:hypothetical protein
VRAPDRLRFDCRIPPRIEDEYIISKRKIQTGSARFQAHDKHRRSTF